MVQALAHAPIRHIGAAVSGGGDSMALLHLLHAWAAAAGLPLSVVTVDHGLRPEAGDEAGFVARICADLKRPHAIVTWQGWDGTGNLQDAARHARYGLITAWAQGAGVDCVALGHTSDDQAETFLMRLMRGSGVDGLAAMRDDWQSGGLRWLRPLIGETRAALRDYLSGNGLRWIDDPSNDDARFDRVRMRRALEILKPLGITVDRLAETAGRMELARRALSRCAHDAATQFCRIEAGDVLIDRGGLAELEDEIRERLFAHALMWVSGAAYRPRLDALRDTLDRVLAGEARTLHGCLVAPTARGLRVGREARAVRDLVSQPDGLWDNRWRLNGNPGPGAEIRALGEDGLGQCKAWRDTGLPRATLIASPAVWRGSDLVAAPLAGRAGGWSAQIAPPRGDFFTSLLSH